MILSLIVIGMVGGLTYLWLTRGFFNSFLHMICVLLGGAIAFAAWEPVSYTLLGVLPSTGTFGFLQGCAWAFGLRHWLPALLAQRISAIASLNVVTTRKSTSCGDTLKDHVHSLS